MPLGLAAKGATGASPDFPPVGLVGVAGFVGENATYDSNSKRRTEWLQRAFGG